MSKTPTISVRLDTDIAATVMRAAAKERRKLSQMVTVIVSEWAEKWGKDNPPVTRPSRNQGSRRNVEP